MAINGCVSVDSNLVEQCAHLRGATLLVADTPDVQSLGDDVLDPATRVQRRDRVLEDHLQLRPGAAERRAAQRREVRAIEPHAAGRRPGKLERSPTRRRLPASRLSNEAKRLAPLDVEADVGDGVHGATPSRWELHDDVLETQERLVSGPQMRRPAPRHQLTPSTGTVSPPRRASTAATPAFSFLTNAACHSRGR